MAAQYTEEFKNDAARYWKKHPELGIAKRAKNLGVSKTALSNWRRIYDSNEGTVPTRGRGNFESDDAKELARLRKELRDTRDALDVLKKQSTYWENDGGSLPGNCPVRRAGSGRGETPTKCLRCAEDLRRFEKRIPCMEKPPSLKQGEKKGA